MGRLTDKNILITGGNSGIGLAAAQEFDREGARVAICGLNEGTLQAAKETLGAGSLAVRADVSNLADLDTMFATIKREFGHLDGVFVNAGYSEFLLFEEVTEQSFDKVIAVNFKGAYFTIQKALPLLRQGSSVIINASVGARKGWPTTSTVSTCKAAVVHLARILSAELVDRGIRVNTLSPGPTDTAMFGRFPGEEQGEAVKGVLANQQSKQADGRSVGNREAGSLPRVGRFCVRRRGRLPDRRRGHGHFGRGRLSQNAKATEIHLHVSEKKQKKLNRLDKHSNMNATDDITTEESSAVTLDHVTRTYKRDEFEVRALNDVTLDIPRKSFVAIMGPSGSGKTTLLNLVTGIDHATSGRVAVGGEEISTMNEREIAAWRARHIGLVFQFYNLIPVLTAFENVELPLLLTHLSKADRKTHVESALKAVGLADRMGHYPRQLSGGQEQRVAIARAIVTDPTILVADEPTGDLDAKSAEEILILLTQLKTQFDKTIVMVTHDPRSERFVDTVYRLDKGVFIGAEKGGASTKATASLQISA